METTHDSALPPQPILLVFLFVCQLFVLNRKVQTSRMVNFSTYKMFENQLMLMFQCFRYLDLDDIIEESSIETDDGAEEEEEDSDG